MLTVVLFLLADKKIAKIQAQHSLNLHSFKNDQLIFVHVSSPADLHAVYERVQETLSPACTVLLHKISDFFESHPDSLQCLENFSKAHPQVRLVDPIQPVMILGDRKATVEMLSVICDGTSVIKLPPTILVSLQDLKQGSSSSDLSGSSIIEYPAILKPLDACTREHCHSMHILGHPRHLACLRDQLEREPHILQQYIPHHGILYKVYVVGGHVSVVMRPSIDERHGEVISDPALTFDTDVDDKQSIGGPLHFDSQHLKFQQRLVPGTAPFTDALARLAPWEPTIRAFSAHLSRTLGLSLFGWDLIIGEAATASGSGTPYIIDLNFFPGFDGVPDFAGSLCDLFIADSLQVNFQSKSVLRVSGIGGSTDLSPSPSPAPSR